MTTKFLFMRVEPLDIVDRLSLSAKARLTAKSL
jgi:hypothetical protein